MEISRSLVIKSLFWKFFERLGTQLVGFIITIVLARLLLPEQYGVIALIMIFINVCNVIIEGGLNTALVQKKNADSVDFSTVFYFSVFISIVLYGVLFISAPYIARFYNEPVLIDVIKVLGLSIIFYAINSIQRAYVSKHMLFNKLFYSSFVAVLLSGVAGVFFAYRGWGVWALVIQNLSCAIITCLVMWFTIRWRPLLKFSVSRFKGLFNYGWKIFSANFITVVFVEIRKVLVGKIYTPSSLALYEKGEQFPSLFMSNILSSIQSVLLPTLSECQDDKARVKAIMRKFTKTSCFIIYPLMVGLIVTAEPMVDLLLGENWKGVVPFIQIMCVANFFRPITISNWEAIKALGYSGITLKLEVLKKIIDIVILLVSIRFGVIAIAWGVVVFNFCCVFVNLAPNVRLLNYRILEQIKDALPTFLIAIMMGGIVWLVRYMNLSDIGELLFQVPLGLIIYILLCVLFKEESFVYLTSLVKTYLKKQVQS